jgi:hypothetical protein
MHGRKAFRDTTVAHSTARFAGVIALFAACMWGSTSSTAAGFQSPAAGDVLLATGPIIDLDFWNISGATVPDRSGHANDGAGKKGAIGFETSWSPTTTADALGNRAVVIDGTQMQRIEIPNRSGSLDVNRFSILVQFTLDASVDTDPAHLRYELMEKAGSFWFNVRQDTTPKYLLRVGGYFNGRARALTGTRVIPDRTLTWAIGTYDGAYLKTYVADGDGRNLVLDNSVAQTGTVATGATITGIDENLVVGAKHRMGHWVDGTGTENLEGMFNGTMSRFIVFNTALTQNEIASVISGSLPVVHAYTVTPQGLAFGKQTLTTSRTKNFWLSNTGSTALPIQGMSMTGKNPASFSVSHNCAPWVPVGTGCTVRVTYRPTWQADHSAVLRIAAGDNPTLRPVTGTGVVSAFTLVPRSLYFGGVPVGTTSSSQTVTIVNSGLGLLPIGSIVLNGTNKYQFTISHNCPSQVSVGGRCTVTVRFKPSATGAKSAYLAVWAAGGAGGKSVALYGTGR